VTLQLHITCSYSDGEHMKENASDARRNRQAPIGPEMTQCNNAIEALRKSEEKYRSLVESSGFGIATIDFMGRFTFANKTLCKMIGYSEKELMGKNFAGFLHPEDRQRILQIFLNAWKYPNRKPSLEFRVIHKKGSPIYMYSSPTLFRMNGKIVGFSAIIRNVTKRKKAEQALKESEEKYRNIVDLAPDGIITVDLKGVITCVNAAFTRLTGYSEKEVVGKHFTGIDALRTEDINYYLKLFDSVADGQTLPPTEFVYLRKDGTERIAEVHFGFLKSDGKTVGIQVVFIDISERKKAEKAIRESQQKFQRLFAGIPEAAAYWDSNFRFLDINPRFTELFGYSLEEIRGKVNTSLIVPENKVDESNLWAKNAREGYIDHDTIRKRKDGSLVDVSMSVAPIIIQDQLIGHVGLYKDITKRKQMEEELRKSEEKYRNLFENARDVILTADMSENITSANNIVSEYGYKPNELVGKNLFSLFPEEYWKEFQSYFQKLTEGKPIEGEFRVKSKRMQGCRVIEYKSSPMIQNGKVIGAQVIARDITERKEMEEELKKQKEEAEQYLDIVGNVIVALDANGKIILLNKKGYAVLGYDEGELIGKNWFETCLPEEVRNEVRTVFRGLMQGKLELYEYEENLVLTKAGEKRIVSWYNRLLKDDFDKIIGTLSSGEDITERKGMEQRLKQYSENLEELVQKRTDELLESEERYSILVEEAGDGVVIIQDEKIVFVNREAAEMFGYPENEIVGLDVEKVVDAKDYPIVKKRYEKRLRGEDAPPTYEIEIVDKAGQHLPFELSSVRINRQGQPAVLAILRDIRERKRTEEQRLRLERLAAIGELAAMVAHDLRNPLTSVRNASFYIRNACPDAPSAYSETTMEMLDIIEQETLFAENVISDLLDFASMRPLEKEKKDIVEIIESSLAKNSMPENIKIRKEFAETTLTVDEKQLERVFLNLVKNAVQAMSNGGELTIRINSTKEQVEITFTDTGIGIPEENMRKIFQPLFTTKAKGIGMGLPICKKIIEEHGGRIEVESKVNQGTTFRIKLPREANDQ